MKHFSNFLDAIFQPFMLIRQTITPKAEISIGSRELMMALWLGQMTRRLQLNVCFGHMMAFRLHTQNVGGMGDV
ncbi:hypothetical protein P5673_017907 [Acropora cervicornis]|uniref:Uncharacterized protein n=1 Tax=Acropora cervicornis TaxID=6130 RepID=A0AAD9QDN9_ACRCE|nr:hypothetical protein P5673_017907 [Acropora cervicornis]